MKRAQPVADPIARRYPALPGVLVAGIAGLSLAGCGVARQELYAPRTEAIDIRQWTNETPGTITVEARDGARLTGYFWPEAEGDRDIFIFFHGRGAHQGVGARYAQYLHGRGDAVMVASYRGFGGNAGAPEKQGIERDAAAFISEARRRMGAGARLWLVGHSLGGAVALDAAAGRNDVAGIILISSFARLADAAPWYTRPFLPERWDNLRALARVKAPLLIIQGDHDKVIPADSGARLAAFAQGPAAYVSMGGETHKPPMQQLGPWLSAAIGTMENGGVDHLPPLPAGWSVAVERP